MLDKKSISTSSLLPSLSLADLDKDKVDYMASKVSNLSLVGSKKFKSTPSVEEKISLIRRLASKMEKSNIKKKRKYKNMMKTLPLLRFGSKENISKIVLNEGISSLGEFIDYVFTECSNCVLQEIYISEIKDSKIYDKYKLEEKESYNCKEVKTSALSKVFVNKFNKNDINILKVRLVFEILELFITKGLLNKSGKTYFLLNTNRRLTWNNIKQLKSKHITLDSDVIDEIRSIFDSDTKTYDIVVLIKSLFWFLRKAVVDSILSDIINGIKVKFNLKSISAVSVGSMKLSSDYDISLDTEYDISALIMKRYNKIIETIFKDPSADVFDTNVYGVSFTKKTKDEVFSENHSCNDNNIHYIPMGVKDKSNSDIEVSQMIWCYIKLLLRLNMILMYDDVLYDKLYSYLDDGLRGNLIFDVALDFNNIYKSDVNNYGEIVSRFGMYMLKNKDVGDEDYLVSNFISFVNYNGSETYLTSGAFLDVVINQQMCANKDIIEIKRPYLYFTSFIENMSDLLLHYHKVKYFDRAYNSLLKMSKLLGNRWMSSEMFEKINGNLNSISSIQKKCEEDIYKCNVYEFMYLCIIVINEVSNIFYDYIKNEYPDLESNIVLFSKLRFPDILERTVEDVLELEADKTYDSESENESEYASYTSSRSSVVM